MGTKLQILNGVEEGKDPLDCPQPHPASPTEIESLGHNRSSSPEFLGFTENAKTEHASFYKNLDSLKNRSVAVLPKASLRVSQPRTSKSKASLVWLKGGKYLETITIKEEPVDNYKSPTKETKKHSKSAVKVEVIEIKTEPDVKKTKKIKKTKNLLSNIQNCVEKQETVVRKIKVEKTGKDDTIVKMRQGLVNDTSNAAESKQSQTKNKLNSSSLSKTTLDFKHNVTKQRRQSSKAKKKSNFKCEACGRVYQYLRGLRQHKKLECNVEPQFPCPYCPSRYRYRQNIREHVRNYHEAAFPKWYATHYVMPVFDNMN